MKPIDKFYFVENNIISQDNPVLMRFYLPILGLEATLLYQYLLAFWDNGAVAHSFAEILNHLNVGMQNLETSLEKLVALDLVEFYQDEQGGYVIHLQSLLSAQDFLKNAVYRTLLERKIGQAAVEKMTQTLPEGRRFVASFSKVFQIDEAKPVKESASVQFDLENFKQRMAHDQLRFENEAVDLLQLFAIAEEKKWTWYETYLLAKETAVSHTISIKRMKQKLAQKSVQADFTPQESAIIKEAKAKTPLVFLAEIKQTRQASITRTERKALEDMAELGLLDEVINVIILLTFNKVDSANLNEKYALKVANDFAYQEITSSEEAVLKIRERGKKRQVREESKPASNVPEWSNPDYKNETSLEKQAELEEQKRRLLARLDNGGD